MSTPQIRESIDYESTRKLFRTTSGRSQRSFTIGHETDTRWRKFVQRHSGTEIRQGNGIGSIMVEFSMKLTMALLTGNPLPEIATTIRKMMAPWAIGKVKANLLELHRLLDE